MERSDIQGSCLAPKGSQTRQRNTANVYGKIIIITFHNSPSKFKKKQGSTKYDIPHPRHHPSFD